MIPSNRNNSSLANSVGKQKRGTVGPVMDINNCDSALQINTGSQHRYSNHASTVKNNGTVRFSSLSKTLSKKTGGHSSTKMSSHIAQGNSGKNIQGSVAKKGLRKLKNRGKKGSPKERLTHSMAKNIQKDKNGENIELWDTINMQHMALGLEPQPT